MAADDRDPTSEITILPDGRIYVLGMSEALFDILQELQAGDPRLHELAGKLRAREQDKKDQ
jgi:hypothetical protein